MLDTVSVLDQRKEALEGRSDGLGGTDISAVFSLNPWKSPIDVYLGKLGLSEPQDMTEPMYFGNALEDVVRQAYVRRTGLKVTMPEAKGDHFARVWNGQVMLRHPEVPCILGTPDGLVLDANRGLEIKTAGWKTDDWGKPGSDEVPVPYLLQCAQYMAITDLPAWDLAVLFHGNKLEIYTIKRDAELERNILDAAQAFWNEHIVPQIPPPVDASESYKRFLSKSLKIGNQTFITATPEIEQLAKKLRLLQEDLKDGKQEEKLTKNQLMVLIGENAGANLSDGDTVCWIRPKDSEETDYEGLALSLNPTTEQIAEFTKPKSIAAYVRLYQGKKKGKL